MKKTITTIILASLSQFVTAVPQNLCTAGEEVLLTATLDKVEIGTRENNEIGTEKLVSMCGLVTTDAMHRIVYRFGKKNAVEFSKEFTEFDPIELFPHSTYVGTTYLFRFKSGPTTYLVSRSLVGRFNYISVKIKNSTQEELFFITSDPEISAPIDQFLYSLDTENIENNKIHSHAIKLKSFDF